MLDPSKAEERRQLIAEARERFYQDFGDLDYKVAYQSLFELLWYSQLPCFDIRNITSKEKDEMSLVKKCYWQDKEVSFEVFNLYSKVMTRKSQLLNALAGKLFQGVQNEANR